MDSCTGCGADLNETDGNTFDLGADGIVQLCPDCEVDWFEDEN